MMDGERFSSELFTLYRGLEWTWGRPGGSYSGWLAVILLAREQILSRGRSLAVRMHEAISLGVLLEGSLGR